MPHEFNDSELYSCDNCGNAYPYEELHELEDGRLVCEECLAEIESEQ